MFVVLHRYLKQIDTELAGIDVSGVAESASLATKFRLFMTKGQTFSHQGPARERFYGDVLNLASEVSSIVLIPDTF